ncbi:unnamed protein product [Rhizophagus irregularis]|nr:unnamed protein product [Rhizophagus irregularis]
MTNERSKDNSSENLISNKSHDFIGKFVIGFNKLNNEFINLLEENQNIKQQYKNLEEKNQEISYLNSELNEKNQKILHINSNLIEKNNKISQKNLEILKLKEIDDDNIIKTFKENNEDFLSSFLNKNENLKPTLPIDYKKAIADYLKEIGKVIKDTLATHWNVDFFENVLLVLTIPAEYSEKDYDIMRECAHDANLINDKSSKNLQFITEPEAAAIYCMENELQEDEIGTTFIVVDCGGVTVDLTARKLIGNNPLQYREITEQIILPDVYNRSINFGLTFGQKGITAFARNELNGQNYTTTFCYPNNVF